jgi:hypothetical protein
MHTHNSTTQPPIAHSLPFPLLHSTRSVHTPLPLRTHCRPCISHSRSLCCLRLQIMSSRSNQKTRSASSRRGSASILAAPVPKAGAARARLGLSPLKSGTKRTRAVAHGSDEPKMEESEEQPVNNPAETESHGQSEKQESDAASDRQGECDADANNEVDALGSDAVSKLQLHSPAKKARRGANSPSKRSTKKDPPTSARRLTFGQSQQSTLWARGR